MATKTCQSRSGSAYIIVMGASLLLALFMMASLMAIRVQRLELTNSSDINEARLRAESGIALGIFHIRDNPDNWRGLTNTGTIGNGTNVQVEFIDPHDEDLVDSNDDPIIIQATGTAGAAVQHSRVRLNSKNKGYNCLLSALHSGNDTNIDNSTIHTNGGHELLSFDSTCGVGNASQVHADVAGPNAPNIRGGSTIHGTFSSSGNWPREMPARLGQNVFNFYVAQGETINLNDLWYSDHNQHRLVNRTFDELADWYGINCDVIKAGETNAVVSNRENDLAGLAQNVTDLIYEDGNYNLGCWVYNNQTQTCLANVRLKIESTNEGTQYFSTASVPIAYNEWGFVSGDVAPTWTGNLLSAEWIVTSEFVDDLPGAPDFIATDPQLFDRTYPHDSYVFRNKLLSYHHNPFGSGTTDEEGIYVLDCDDKLVFIENSRVIGTLVLLNCNNATITKSMNMRASVYNYPTLLANGNLNLSLDTEPLDEKKSRTNFNPLEAGYVIQGQLPVADTDQTDTLPSRIDGLIYVESDLTVDTDLSNSGVILSFGDININSATLNLSYNELFFEDPPPGFVGRIEMVVLPGSFRPVAN